LTVFISREKIKALKDDCGRERWLVRDRVDPAAGADTGVGRADKAIYTATGDVELTGHAGAGRTDMTVATNPDTS